MKNKNTPLNPEMFLEEEGFKRLAKIAAVVDMNTEYIACITNAKLSVVEKTLKTGTTANKRINDKLYLLYMLFSELLAFDQHTGTELNYWLADTKEFEQCIVKPPWYPGDLRSYITEGKIRAIHKAIEWFRKY